MQHGLFRVLNYGALKDPESWYFLWNAHKNMILCNEISQIKFRRFPVRFIPGQFTTLSSLLVNYNFTWISEFVALDSSNLSRSKQTQNLKHLCWCVSHLLSWGFRLPQAYYLFSLQPPDVPALSLHSQSPDFHQPTCHPPLTPTTTSSVSHSLISL